MTAPFADADADVDADAAADAAVAAAVAAVARGRMTVVVDDADREDEGDLVMAAGCVTPAAVAFMVHHGSGVVCVALTEERADELRLPLMVASSRDPLGTAFTVTVDAVGTGTGISAADRATTIRALADADSQPERFRRPGHVFPLRARPHGVLGRRGHTEAAVDLARLAGHAPAGVLCEIVRPDGSMARGPDLERFAAEHGLPLLSIADLVRSRRRHEPVFERLGSVPIAARGEPGRGLGSAGRERVGDLDGRGLRVALVASRFNDAVTRRLVEGAADALARTGVAPDDVELAWVPGAFEIPLVARRLAESRRFDAVVGLGAVVRGDTPHFEHVAAQCAAGIAAVGVDTGVPTLFGVLTTDTMEQAVARAGGKAGNKGADAALAAVELARLLLALDAERDGGDR